SAGPFSGVSLRPAGGTTVRSTHPANPEGIAGTADGVSPRKSHRGDQPRFRLERLPHILVARLSQSGWKML
ncbi:MAG: hypothetical protein AAFZ09_12365, partial [Pseudomonadota bacterium]